MAFRTAKDVRWLGEEIDLVDLTCAIRPRPGRIVHHSHQAHIVRGLASMTEQQVTAVRQACSLKDKIPPAVFQMAVVESAVDEVFPVKTDCFVIKRAAKDGFQDILLKR